MKAGLYIRVSTDMQARDGDSLAEQEVSTQGYCNYRNIPIVTVYREEGKSAKNTNRPQFQKMLRDCKLGKIDTIVVKKIDRLSRSLMDFEKTISFFEEHNINLISIHENFDTSSAMGRAVIRIIVTFAQLEREQTSERTIDVLKYRAEQGCWNGGRPPLGYDHDEKLGLVINILESKIVTIIFNKYIELASYKRVAQYINDSGYRTKDYNSRRGKKQGNNTFNDSAIARILKNPLYIGKIKHKGQLHKGKHQSFVSEDIYTQAQEIMEINHRKKSSVKAIGTHNFILERLLKCGLCGAYMTPRWSRSKGRRYFYYECTTVNHGGQHVCKMKAIRAISLESLILRRIRAIKKNDELFKSILKSNSSSLDKEIDTLESERILLNLRLTEVTNKAQAIVDKLLSIIELSNTTLLYDEVNRLDQEKHTMAQKIEELNHKLIQLKNRSFNADNIKGMFEYFTNVYSRVSITNKKVFMGILIKDITYGMDYVSINYHTTIDTIDNNLTDRPVIKEGPRTKLKVCPRPPTGDVENSPYQTVADRFIVSTYIGTNGKILLDF